MQVVSVLQRFAVTIWHAPRFVGICIIRLYQKTLSPDYGPLRYLFPFGYCKFNPSCSQYSIDALRKYGFLIGLGKTVWRILRCNPWSKGGSDPIDK